MKAYDQQDRLLVAVDCIIFGFEAGKLNLLLIRRDFTPRRGEWSLMGGFLRADESLDEAAARVLTELTGLQDVYLEQFRAFGEVDRDEAERTVSVGYYALVEQEKVDRQLSPDYAAHWVPVDEIPSLVFDHRAMVDAALRRLRHRATHEPVGFELLPDKFTISQLQSLYEGIFGTIIDAGNFRRRLRKMDYLERLAEKDTSGSRKGAWYYHFVSERYAAAKSEGVDFLLKP
ncbi:ADP-ribose pyrophosphatase YjhB (NUDIX family) [Neolewinella xylanilytica]|uniref:ADP-ribose pyrophosphatase YjhB (NUDIX family) n=1 Tax=Neolewinella xylanilytica TaxID=1514080 RepID=A0A2S6I1Z3_9BACT|nr:NUDIX domain-containing protein [Neolewinella xylanilytica]PPK85197.1 ADP-ribose pyrophosphatase YjhB (NUDIX family) [Neolewinella xylanilytica]